MRRTVAIRARRFSVFSDALDIPKVLQLYERFRGRCKLAFGDGHESDQRPRL